VEANQLRANPENPLSPRPLSPNEQLKELRSRLGLTTSEVSDRSHKIAKSEGNPEFHISNCWLTQVENSDAIPGIHKLYTLSIIYRIQISDLFLLFGIDLTRLHQHQRQSLLASTHLTTLDAPDPDGKVIFPVRFAPSFDVRHTNLLSRMVEKWGQVPLALVQGLDVRNNMYGYIGLEDYMLYPILRPGSFVQIDPSLRKIVRCGWNSEYERPIYFVELRDGYCCSWCELNQAELLLLPHPLSPCKIKRLVYGVDAEIIGRVTGAGVSFVSTPDTGSELPLSPPKKS
jgi:transcriptional regulator with XRE-family HTH domain